MLILSYAASQIASVLGNIEQLNGSNYASWKEKLEITLALLDTDYCNTPGVSLAKPGSLAPNQVPLTQCKSTWNG